jgi:hypothetical protein
MKTGKETGKKPDRRLTFLLLPGKMQNQPGKKVNA